MKKAFYLLFSVAAFACKKDNSSTNNGAGDERRLTNITTAGQVTQSFEYSGGLLSKENWHSQFCTTPVDEHRYVYANGRLQQMQSAVRSFLSSTGGMCNPAAGQQTIETYEYDGQGRLKKTTRQAGYTEYEYNGDGRVSKQTIFNSNGAAAFWSTFEYDARGNITRETDKNGLSTVYEYDNKTNPLYLIKRRPGLVNPFSTSPNNVIKGVGSSLSFQRNFTEYRDDLPVTVIEGGATYSYEYQ